MKRPHWTNLQTVLGLNQEQGSDMANQVAGNVSGAAQAAKTGITDASASFAHQAARGAQGFDANAGNFDAKRGYTGPSDLGEVDPTLASNVGDAVQRVNQTKTSAGQADLLRQTYGPGNGPTGAGGGALDSFLLSGAGGGAFADLQSKYGDLGDQLKTAQTTASGIAATDKTTANMSAAAAAKAAAEKPAKDAAAQDAALNAEADALGKKVYGNQWDPNHKVYADPNAHAWANTPIAGQMGMPGKNAIAVDPNGQITTRQRMLLAIARSKDWNKKHPGQQLGPERFGAMQQAGD